MATHMPGGTNKRKSGGPKTIGGKTRSSRNAIRHGLTTITLINPAYSSRMIEIAKFLCGDDQDPRLYQKALVVAQCDVLLAEISRYELLLIERLVDPNSLPTRKSKAEWKGRAKFCQRQHVLFDEVMAAHPRAGTPSDEEKTKTFHRLLAEFFGYRENRDGYSAFVAALPDIMRVNRYERRAWSRRQRAFSDFLALKSLSSYPNGRKFLKIAKK